MLSAGPCQRVMWKIRLTTSSKAAATRRLIRGPSEKGRPPIVKVFRRLLSRNAVSHWTPMTNPFETNDITKPKDMPHKMPPPITFSNVRMRSTYDCACKLTANMGDFKVLCFRFFMPKGYTLTQITAALSFTLQKPNMNYRTTHGFLAVRHKFCSAMSLEDLKSHQSHTG